MEATIEIDIGGTFTDCVVVWGDHFVSGKTPTTGYNPSVGFKKAIQEAAGQLNMSMDELLRQTAIIRYSTTLGLNTLIQRTGPRLGLITTAGFEHVILVGRSRQWADGLHAREKRYMYLAKKPEPLIPLEMTVGVRERIDCFGRVVIPLQESDIRAKLRYLVDRGAQGFVVSLLWSFLNPTHEKMIERVIREEYPDAYLGNMLILLSSEVQPKWHEYPRTMVTALSAYLHADMSEQLSTLGEELRDHGYKRPLAVCNSVGGVAKVNRTRAVDTCSAGPVAGLFGSAFMSQVYGFPKVVATDMGGTSFDYGMVLDGNCRFYQKWPVIDRWATERSVIEVNSIGAGGGSVAWLNETVGNKLEVGPLSVGSNPGPACYDLGGSQPTVTDADVVLGYLNPGYFLGGKMRLDKEKAIKAMDKIASPLGLTTIEAACAIRRVIDANMGNTLFKEIVLRGFAPKEFCLFAYGGAGPTHACDFGPIARVSNIVTFPLASVFCALGAATMNLRYIYETSKNLLLRNPGEHETYLADLEEFNRVVDGLREEALRDIRSEGFRAEDVVLDLELDMRYSKQLTVTRVISPRLRLQSEKDAEAICSSFRKTFVAQYSELVANPKAGIVVVSFYLIASVPLAKPKLPVFELSGDSPERAFVGTRSVYWREYGSFKETNILNTDLLQAGNVVHGPAVIEAKDTTVVIPPGTKYVLDRHLTATLEKE